MIYLTIHFLHVLGAMGIVAAYSVEAAGLVGLRRATSAEEARTWLLTRRWILLLGPPSIILVLASGGYMSSQGWSWPGWIVVSLIGVITVALLGGVLTGIPMSRVVTLLERATGTLTEELRRAIRSRRLTLSMGTRLAITSGILLLMVRKADFTESSVCLIAAASIGAVAGWFWPSASTF
jgi:hypothetical protein